jgi:hypothetical protein
MLAITKQCACLRRVNQEARPLMPRVWRKLKYVDRLDRADNRVDAPTREAADRKNDPVSPDMEPPDLTEISLSRRADHWISN